MESKMETKINTIFINGVEYVEKSTVSQSSTQVDGLDYVVVRGDRSGAFAGFLESRNGREVILKECRRLWYWNGAASLSGLAVDGVSKPKDCKFTSPARIQILDAIEIINTTKKAMDSIKEVAIWKA